MRTHYIVATMNETNENNNEDEQDSQVVAAAEIPAERRKEGNKRAGTFNRIVAFPYLVPVTPDDEQGKKKKTRTAVYRVKSQDEITPTNMMSSSPMAYIESLRGGMDIIDIHAGENEAFLYPFTRLMFSPDPNNRSEMRQRKALMNETNIIACLPQRASPYDNVAKLRLQKLSNNKNSDQRFKRQYLVRFNGHGVVSSAAEKQRVLQVVVDVSLAEAVKMASMEKILTLLLVFESPPSSEE